MEKDFRFSFLNLVINDFSKCEVGSERFCCAGSSKEPSNYLSRISYFRIRGQVAVAFHAFFFFLLCKEIISTEWFSLGQPPVPGPRPRGCVRARVCVCAHSRDICACDCTYPEHEVRNRDSRFPFSTHNSA